MAGMHGLLRQETWTRNVRKLFLARLPISPDKEHLEICVLRSLDAKVLFFPHCLIFRSVLSGSSAAYAISALNGSLGFTCSLSNFSAIEGLELVLHNSVVSSVCHVNILRRLCVNAFIFKKEFFFSFSAFFICKQLLISSSSIGYNQPSRRQEIFACPWKTGGFGGLVPTGQAAPFPSLKPTFLDEPIRFLRSLTHSPHQPPTNLFDWLKWKCR